MKKMKDRYYYFDYLRIFASAGIVMIHVASYEWFNYSIDSFNWIVANFFHSFGRWAVPIFFMISGTLFLSRDISVSSIWKKYVKRLLIIFYSWSLLYAVAIYVNGRDLSDAINHFLAGNYQEWYLVTTIGLYITTPILKKIVENKKICEYFLILSFVFGSLIFAFNNYLALAGGYEPVSDFINDLALSNIPCCFGYYALGYYLNTYEIKNKKAIYLLAVIGVFLRLFESYGISLGGGLRYEACYDYPMPNVYFFAMALFIYAKSKFNKPNIKSFITNMSKYTLCIYMVHPLVLALLHKVDIISSNLSTAITIPCYFMITYLLSTLIAMVMNKIPVVNKHLV